MLVKPLFDEFGIPRVLVYLAQTPFVVEQNDLESSALRYQIRARESLEAEVGNKLIQTAEAESLRGTAD